MKYYTRKNEIIRSLSKIILNCIRLTYRGLHLLQSFRICTRHRNCYQTNLKNYDSRVHVRNLNILVTNNHYTND